MTLNDPKAVLHRYLRSAHEELLWKTDGLSEYDVRRPLTPTGTNLLGMLKHLATVAYGYFGDTFDRPYQDALPWNARTTRTFRKPTRVGGSNTGAGWSRWPSKPAADRHCRAHSAPTATGTPSVIATRSG